MIRLLTWNNCGITVILKFCTALFTPAVQMIISNICELQCICILTHMMCICKYMTNTDFLQCQLQTNPRIQTTNGVQYCNINTNSKLCVKFSLFKYILWYLFAKASKYPDTKSGIRCINTDSIVSTSNNFAVMQAKLSSADRESIAHNGPPKTRLLFTLYYRIYASREQLNEFVEVALFSLQLVNQNTHYFASQLDNQLFKSTPLPHISCQV